jgi:amidohydrolase
VDLLEHAVRAELGPQAVAPTEQSLGGEDFGWYLEAIRGALARLGTRRPGGHTYDLHRGDFEPDEDAIGVGVRLLVAAALASPWDPPRA